MKIKKVLFGKEKKYYWIEGDLHTQHGVIKGTDISTAEEPIKSHMNKEFLISEANFKDNTDKLKRGPQAMHSKDIGQIISNTGINKNSKVIDAGVGSGMNTCHLANIVKTVYGYERRPEFLKIAEKNIKSLDLKNVKLKDKDIYEGISEKDVDLISLDLAEPWQVIPHAEKALKSGGYLVSYSPSTPQVSDFVEAIRANKNFKLVKVIETIERPWKVNGRTIHPEFQILGHTGFLTFVRRI
jgi:tRNA (adenine57-N1/adenine58-N1)-methyltransferase catalytic subunit